MPDLLWGFSHNLPRPHSGEGDGILGSACDILLVAMFRNKNAPAANKATAVSLQQAILFAAGFAVSVIAALIGRMFTGRNRGAGWVYLGSITVRMMGLLIGCTAIYLSASQSKFSMTVAYAIGIVAGWFAHFAFALVALRK